MNEFQKLQSERLAQYRKKKCSTCAGVLALPKKKIKEFYEAMLDNTVTAPVISQVLENWGITASVTAITNHRRGKDGYATHMDQIKKAAGL